MGWVARFFKKKILLKYDNDSIEELFLSSFVEQINDFQVHLSSLIIFLYSTINVIINITDQDRENRITQITLFSVQLGISLIVLIIGRSIVCSRFILLYVQQILFVAIHTLLILAANDKSEKLYLILVSFSLHILIMPQSQHVYIMLSNIIYFSFLMISFSQFDWKEMWQVWIFLGIVGLELRLLVDEKQKRLLFHDESYLLGQQIDDQDINLMMQEAAVQGDQGSPTSSTRYINIKQIGVNVPPDQQYRQLQPKRPTIGNQQTQQHSGNNILINQGSNNPENIETHRQIPYTSQSPQSNQQKQLQMQNSKGGYSSQSVFNHQFSTTKQNSINFNVLNVPNNNQNQPPQKQKNDTIIQSSFKERSNTVSNLKRKMTVFQMRKGMEDLRKLIYSSSMMMNNEGQPAAMNSGRIETNNLLSNSYRQEIPYALQLSPLIQNTYESPVNQNSAQMRRVKQNNIYNLMPFSFIYGKLDPSNVESIQLIFANNKAKNDYQIQDSVKLDEFLKKCKISSVLLKSPDSSINSLKKIIVINYQQILEENRNQKSQINSNPSILSPEFKRNGNAHFTVNENQLGIYSNGQMKRNNYNQRLSILPNRSNTSNDPKDKENKGIPVLIDFYGRKYVAKVFILQNDEFFIFINDDGFEKFILEKKKRQTCDQLVNIIAMMINRFETIQQLLYNDDPISKKEIFMETLLATNYAQNIQYSIKEQLQYHIEIINRKIVFPDTLYRVKEMVERKYKKVQILVDEDIPNECKKIYNDPFHLVRTLTNIIENAYNNTKAGFVQILIHQSRIFKDHLRFDIIDSGQGIDPAIVRLINDNNFFNDEEEEDVVNKLFLIFASIQQKSNNPNNGADEKEQNKLQVEDSIIKGFGLKFSHHMIKIIGPYNRMYAESIPGIGSRISFVVYKEGPPAQDTMFKPYQFKNNNFEQEMEFFNPLNKSSSNQQNCDLSQYIEHVTKEVLSKLEPPSLNNSLVNINHPAETKKFNSPFAVIKQKENDTRVTRSTSAHQIKQYKNKISFNKIKSQKSILENQRNLFINKQLSPLISGMPVANTVQYKIGNQNSLALSLSPPGGYINNNLNPLYNQDIVENISHHFRNINPVSSQMYSENIYNGLNNTQLSIQSNYRHPLLSKTSPKENISHNNLNLVPNIYFNIRRNNSNPNNSNQFFVQESNFPSAINSPNNSNLNIIPQVISNNSLTNISNNILQNGNISNLQNNKNGKTNNQLMVPPSFQDKFLLDLNLDPPSNTQEVINDQYQAQEQVGYFINRLQKTN